MFTGQFTDKRTRSQSSHGLVNSQTTQLAKSEFFKNHGQIVISGRSKFGFGLAAECGQFCIFDQYSASAECENNFFCGQTFG